MSQLTSQSSTALEYDPDSVLDYLSPDSIPQNVPTTGEGSVVIAPFLHEPVSSLLLFLIRSSLIYLHVLAFTA